MRILYVQHELYTWNHAKMWGYEMHLGFEAGFRANGIDFFTLTTPWIPQARQILKGMSFDQVWINDITHICEPGACGGYQVKLDELEWIASLAPVCVGNLVESLSYRKEDYEENPALYHVRHMLPKTIGNLTHIMTPDENDLDTIREICDIPTLWLLCPMPNYYITREIALPRSDKAFFNGTLYGKRAGWLNNPRLSSLLTKQVSSDNTSDIPGRFDALHRQCLSTLQNPVTDISAAYGDYIETLRELRSRAFTMYLESMRNGIAAVVLPAYSGIYTASVYEGMAAGRPVIAATPRNRPLLQNVFHNGNDILLFNDDDPEQLAKHIEYVREDPASGMRIAQNARDTLLKRHTIEQRVSDIISWIETGRQPDYTIPHAEGSCKELPGPESINIPRLEKVSRPRTVQRTGDKKLRILFISPPYARIMGLGNCRFPLSFGNMATILAQNGHEVGIFDADFDRGLIGRSGNYEYTFTHQDLIANAIADDSHPIWEEVAAQVRDFRPDLVGITAMTTKYPTASRIAGIVKAVNPDIRIVIGGHHPSIFGGQLLHDKNIDFAVVGEGEMTMLELVNRLTDPRPDYSAVKGLVYRDGGKTVTTEPRRLIRDLEALPVAERGLMINAGYVSENNIMTSRGCPFNCHYCGAQIIWQHKVRRRSVGHVMKEIDYLLCRTKSRNISFWDDSFTMGKKYTLELADALRQRPGITFSCITRLDLIDDAILSGLKQAGCNTILFGIESGSDKMLSLMNKKMGRDFIRKQIDLVRKHQVNWIGFFIMGYPGETRDEIFKTLQFMKELDPPYAEINIFNPLPGTKIWDDLEAVHEVSRTMDFSKFSQSSLNNYFLKDIPQEEFQDIALKIIREFDRHNLEKSQGKK